MPDIDANLTAGIEAKGYREGGTTADSWVQYVAVRKDRIESFRGRAGTFRQLGIAGTTGQRLFTIYNAAASPVIVDVEAITVDVYQTAARVVAPPVLRMHRLTAVALGGGTAVSKVAEDTALTSNASVTMLQGTASDAGAATAITGTIAAGTILTQEPVARALTLVGYEQFDRTEFFAGSPITLRADQGIIVNLDYTVATSNPITDNYTVTARWTEYTRP